MKLTPAEELGLEGRRLASRVRAAFFGLSTEETTAMLDDIERSSRENHLVYLRDGVKDVVRVLPDPVVAMPDQVAYVHSATWTLDKSLKRLAELYFVDEQVRAILRLPDPEEEWLREARPASRLESDPVFGRHDAVVDFSRADWKSTLSFLEPNMSGIGGLHFVPMAERLVAEIVAPRLAARDPSLVFELGQDIRNLLMQEMLDHLEVLGRAPRRVCFVEPKYSDTGPDEQDVIAAYFHDHFGIEVRHADPSELRLSGQEVLYEGASIDLAYRDYSVADLLELAATGIDVRPMRALFAQNRMVSSLSAEIDQKSCFEVLSDPEIVERHFGSDDRQIFYRHVPWTRIVSERKTLLPHGTHGDLLPYLRSDRERLVLKPNRSYGGHGVTLGAATTQGVWERALEVALADPARWVAQRAVDLPVFDFTVRDDHGEVGHEPFYTVMGFAASRDGLAILGRASQKQVVNVALKGGLCAILVAVPPMGSAR